MARHALTASRVAERLRQKNKNNRRYRLRKKLGLPGLPSGPSRRPIEDVLKPHPRFPGNPCWIVTSHRPSKNGKGYIRVGRKQVWVHRAVYETVWGPIPEGLIVRHRCDEPTCINPLHLEVGTHADNVADMDARGRRRSVRGERVGTAKLTHLKVLQIVALTERGVSTGEIAKAFQVHCSTISHIEKGRAWQHVPLARSTA